MLRGGKRAAYSLETTRFTWTNDMPDATTPVAALKEGIRQFAADRGWGPYHTPKNLTMALASEVGELCDVFRWLTPEESVTAANDPGLREAIADELADVANILFLLSDHTGIELSEAVAAKMAKNAIKYPIPTKDVGME
jgi:NTP pyrophosphatase (non-canonical NTP hydrolase)